MASPAPEPDERERLFNRMVEIAEGLFRQLIAAYVVIIALVVALCWEVARHG